MAKVVRNNIDNWLIDDQGRFAMLDVTPKIVNSLG